MATKTNTVTTSVVVQFTTGEGEAVLVAEVDDREAVDGGLNGGKTSFLPGDSVYILRYRSKNVIMDSEQASLGSLSGGSSTTVDKEEDVTFAGETEASLRYPVSGGFSYEWIGNSPGAITLVGETKLKIPDAEPGVYPVGVAKVKYTSTAEVFQLSHGALAIPEYSIVVFFAGHVGAV
jgi:hypothetical protein